MKRNATIALAAVLVLLGVAWFTCRVPYHQWRWQASIRNADRLRAGEYNQSDAVADLLRGEPKTAQDYDAAAAKHEAALIRLGYLARKEFRFSNPLRSDAAIAQFLSRAAERFPRRDEWSALFSTRGDSVTITTLKSKMPEWEKFISDLDRTKSAKRTSRCKRRSRAPDTVQVRWYR